MTDNTVRYDICDREDEPFMESCEDGDWVNFADYARLKARIEALEARVAAADALALVAESCEEWGPLTIAIASYRATKENGR